ncbi:hypothetical protein BCR34DRAFT_603748 [Clohesyomyces aquaticus]|uniref:Cytidyltransferase-like domain-containing protein n=1 Tax=Clohesyomyces aquaticus TaxID=1231657 RepID=A0A1Y1ZCI1_9PLEO|nr:hypothetical protein BCR34DRAFT_603748 [Clohesyomyces aquaticus]
MGDQDAEIFAKSTDVATSTLVKGRVNRILTFRGSSNPPHQGHEDALVMASSVESEVGFRPLVPYEEWMILSLYDDFVHRLGTDGNCQWLEQNLEMLFPDQLRDAPSNWRDEQWVRYVPTRFIGMTGGAEWLARPALKEEQLSSTRIRRILQDTDDVDEALNAVSGEALSPQILIEYIQQHKEQARVEEMLQKARVQRTQDRILYRELQE